MNKKIKDIDDLLDTIDRDVIAAYLGRKPAKELILKDESGREWTEDPELIPMVNEWDALRLEIAQFAEDVSIEETVSVPVTFFLQNTFHDQNTGWWQPLDDKYTTEHGEFDYDDAVDFIAEKCPHYTSKLSKKVKEKFFPRVKEFRKKIYAFVKKWKAIGVDIDKTMVNDYLVYPD
jgi:hypothetical protein